MGVMTSFAVLTKNVPAPFSKEFSGGPGMHIHDKFVVVDFNAENPTVFTGSSNLAAGGEEQNGDSLAMIEDATIANMFAIEAVALFDHYHFRKVMQTVSAKEPPLTLWYPGKPNAQQPWWKPYYDLRRIQMRDRLLFAGRPLPTGLAATKNVDWSAIDAADTQKSPRGGKKGGHSGAGADTTSARRGLSKRIPSKKAGARKPAAKKAVAKKAVAKKAVGKKAAGRKTRKIPAKSAAKKTGRATNRKSARKKPPRKSRA
jgi:hypothetical protein